mgnify:FL=1
MIAVHFACIGVATPRLVTVTIMSKAIIAIELHVSGSLLKEGCGHLSSIADS